jgi:DNA polymerase I-like protein with 3'-5' exonuclease and polymerase domains
MENINWNNQKYDWKWWDKSDGNIGTCSLDTETTLIVPGEVPEYILGMAYNGKCVYLIKKQDIVSFFKLNNKDRIFYANAAFDLFVLEKMNAINLIDEVEKGHKRVVDLLLLGQLVDIAQKGITKPHSLDSLTQKYLEVKMDKKIEAEVDGEIVDVRMSYDRFLRDEKVDYIKMESIHEFIHYACVDAVVTFELSKKIGQQVGKICKDFNVSINKMLSHDIQLKASIVLNQISLNGIATDLEYRDALYKELRDDLDASVDELKKHNWQPGTGSGARLQEILSELEVELDYELPRTGKSLKISSSAEDLTPLESKSEFVKAYINFQKVKKLLDFTCLGVKIKKHDIGKEDIPSDLLPSRVHARFNALVATGRTSCTKPNLQNLPRDPRIRPMFTAKKGHCIVGTDYNALELAALAQTCYERFGFSAMGDKINKGEDLHYALASKITGKEIKDVTKGERQGAKAINFGAPGLMGAETLAGTAKTSYGVDMSEEEAQDFIEMWKETYPEMENHLDNKNLNLVMQLPGFNKYAEFTDKKCKYETQPAWAFLGIIKGKEETGGGREYTQEEIDWSFNILNSLNWENKTKWSRNIQAKEGDWKMLNDFVSHFKVNAVRLSTGLVRNGCSPSAACNTWFQGTAAAGAKVAMWELFKNGFRRKMINFIHDEVLFELKEDDTLSAEVSKLEKIMVDAMEVLTPYVKIGVESEFMRSWHKSGTHMLNKKGKLDPFE